MVLRFNIENEPNLPDGGPVSFTVTGRRSVDIGRDRHLDWTLPDPARMMGWRARLAQYQVARHRPASERDGWLSLDDPDEYDFAACRWPVLAADAVRGPPPTEARDSA